MNKDGYYIGGGFGSGGSGGGSGGDSGGIIVDGDGNISYEVTDPIYIDDDGNVFLSQDEKNGIIYIEDGKLFVEKVM